MTPYAVLIMIFILITCCPHDSGSLTLKTPLTLMQSIIQSSGQSTACSYDKNTLRGDFMCHTKTCFNITTGEVIVNRHSCHRIKDRIATFDERSRNLINAALIPMNALRMIIKGSWKDWLGLQFIDYLARQIEFL
jgi:hypothetical protein